MIPPVSFRPRQVLALAFALLASDRSSPMTDLAPPPPAVTEFLTRSIGLSPDELRAVERGEVITRSLQTTEGRDVTIFAVAVSNAERDAVTARLVDLPAALRAPGRTAVGIVQDPAAAEDFAALSLSPRDADALRNCRPGSCDFKLGADDMAQARALLEQSTDSATATRFVQTRLADIANAYRRIGNAAMPVYADQGSGDASGAEALSALLGQTPAIFQFAVGLRACLSDFPRTRLVGARETLYWARDEISGLQTITTLNQRIVYSPWDAPTVTIAATKQLSANHYLEAAVEILAVIERPAASGGGSYLLLQRQYRFDHMPRAFLFSLRGRIVGRLRERAAADIARLRDG